MALWGAGHYCIQYCMALWGAGHWCIQYCMTLWGAGHYCIQYCMTLWGAGHYCIQYCMALWGDGQHSLNPCVLLWDDGRCARNDDLPSEDPGTDVSAQHYLELLILHARPFVLSHLAMLAEPAPSHVPGAKQHPRGYGAIRGMPEGRRGAREGVAEPAGVPIRDTLRAPCVQTVRQDHGFQELRARYTVLDGLVEEWKSRAQVSEARVPVLEARVNELEQQVAEARAGGGQVGVGPARPPLPLLPCRKWGSAATCGPWVHEEALPKNSTLPPSFSPLHASTSWPGRAAPASVTQNERTSASGGRASPRLDEKHKDPLEQKGSHDAEGGGGVQSEVRREGREWTPEEAMDFA